MELGSDQIVPPDNRRYRPAIVRTRDDIGLIGRLQMEGVDEIGVQPVRARRNAVQDGVRARLFQHVPAHVRNFQVWIRWFDGGDIAGNPAESVGYAMLQTAFRHELHADADPEKGNLLHGDRVEECPLHAWHGCDA